MTYRTAAVLIALIAAGAPCAAAQSGAAPRLALAFAPDGTVTLDAQNVTVRQILAEWQHRCGCYVVNGDRLAGPPLSIPIHFEHAPQAVVLDSLLRQAAGYVLTPRRTGSTMASNFEVIYILPTSNASAAPATSYSAPAAQPFVVPIATAGSPDDEIPPVQPVKNEEKPAAPPPAARPNAPGVAIVPIVPIGPASTGPAPGTSTPAPGTSTPAPR